MGIVSSFGWVKNPNWKFVFLGLFILCIGIGIKHYLSTFHDYGIYFEAGQKILRGDGHLLYDRNRTEPGGFYYPYFWAVLFAGFIKISLGLDKIVFMFLFCFSFLKLVLFSTRFAISNLKLPKDFHYFVSAITLFLGIYAFNDSLMNSNIGILLALTSVLSFEFFERKKFLASGFFLALGIGMKFYPLVLLGYWIWRKEFKVVLWTALFTVLFIVGIPCLIEGFSSGLSLVSDNFYVMSRYSNQIGWNYSGIMFQNFTATGLRYLSLIGVTEAQAFRPLFIVFSLLVVGIYFPSFVKKQNAELKNLVLIPSMALVPLLTPISWYNMGVFYLPMIAYFVGQAFLKKSSSHQIALGVFFLFYSLSPQGIVSKSVNDFLEFWGFPFFGIMALFSKLAWDLFVSKKLKSIN